MFRKRDSEIIDYTDRGKNIPEIKTNYKMSKDGFVEFTGEALNQSTGNTTPSLSNSNKSMPSFDFLDSPAPSVSSGNPQSISSGFDFLESTSNLDSNPIGNINTNLDSSGEIEDIKRMVKNVSSMTNDNSNELYRLIQRIEAIERKLKLI